MEYRKLGRSSVTVSEISLGCWTMGGLNWVDGQANGWANVNEDEIVSAVKRAVREASHVRALQVAADVMDMGDSLQIKEYLNNEVLNRRA